MGIAALLGSPIKRREDPRLITGQATYVDDIKLPGMVPMAVGIAEDRYTVRDARDVIEVDYEPLPAVVDVEKAMQPDAPLLYEEFQTNVAFSMHPPTDAIDKVFEQTKADGGVVVKARLV